MLHYYNVFHYMAWAFHFYRQRLYFRFRWHAIITRTALPDFDVLERRRPAKPNFSL